jgi:hypothetical protein
MSVDRVSAISTKQWVADVAGRSTQFAASNTGGNGVVILAITQVKGPGSVFELSAGGNVQCLLGLRGSGTEEALTIAVGKLLKCRQIVLTLAIPNITTEAVHSILACVKSNLA